MMRMMIAMIMVTIVAHIVVNKIIAPTTKDENTDETVQMEEGIPMSSILDMTSYKDSTGMSSVRLRTKHSRIHHLCPTDIRPAMKSFAATRQKIELTDPSSPPSRRKCSNLFQMGRVFRMLWSETYEDDLARLARSYKCSSVRHMDIARHSPPRHSIVICQYRDTIVALPIQTSGARGARPAKLIRDRSWKENYRDHKMKRKSPIKKFLVLEGDGSNQQIMEDLHRQQE